MRDDIVDFYPRHDVRKCSQFSLRYFGPGVHKNMPKIGDHRK